MAEKLTSIEKAAQDFRLAQQQAKAQDRITKYTLDITKWICGLPQQNLHRPDNFLGRGFTQLENVQGFMCCLGQFAHQVNPELNIVNLGQPKSLAEKYELVYDQNFVYKNGWGYYLTNLAISCININDNKSTTVAQKIKLLIEALATEGITLDIVNGEKYGYQ